MERDDLDRFLTDDEIVPSSGFVARRVAGVRSGDGVAAARARALMITSH